MKYKYQIIGGSGFVGSRLISLLDQENCSNLDKQNSPFYKSITKIGDIRHYEQIIFDPNCDCVILLAAEHRDDVSPTKLYYDVNVEGTRNVLKKMDELGITKIIFTSSVAIYGLNKKNPSETHKADPFNHYGKSKLLAENEIINWVNKDKKNKSAVIIRPTVIFGERNRGNVYNLLKQISSGKFLMIGRGTNKKSMAYVGNVVAFIKKTANLNQIGYSIYNYVDKPDFSMSDLVNLIERHIKIKVPSFSIPFWIGMIGGYFFDLISIFFKKKLSISSVRVKKFCATTQFNSKKMNLIFKPPYTLEQGLKNTLDYEFLKKNKDDIIFYSE